MALAASEQSQIFASVLAAEEKSNIKEVKTILVKKNEAVKQILQAESKTATADKAALCV